MKTRKISTQLTIKFSLIMIILVILFNFILSIIFGGELREQNKIILEKKLNLIDNEISENYGIILDLIKEIRQDVILKSLVRRVKNSKELETFGRSQISETLYTYSQKDDFVSSLVLLDNARKPLDVNFENKDLVEKLRTNKELNYFIKNNLFTYFSGEFSQIYNTSSNFTYGDAITCFSEYYSDNNFEQLGYLLINLDSEQFFSSTLDLFRKSFDSAYILNEKGNSIYNQGIVSLESVDERIHLKNRGTLFKYDNLYRIDGKRYLLYEYTLKNFPNIKILGLVLYEKEVSSFDKSLGTSLIIALLFIIIIIFSTNVVSFRITAPIRQICEAMILLKKEDTFPDDLPLEETEELNVLVSGFNDMVKNIRNLIYKIKEKEKKEKEYEVAKVKSDLALLQAQMNPHFIHNTLNTISILSMEKGCNDITEMIKSLNLLLRGSMDIQRRYITIKEEMLNVKGYIELHKYRYDLEFNFNYECPKEYRLCMIPKFILQPLVENSLYHGIIPKNTDGNITVEVSKVEDKDDLLIRIIDDGIGIPQDKMATLFNKDIESDADGFNHLCLSNMKRRLHFSFGETYNIEIFSEVDKGTVVQFSIPVLFDYED